MNLLQENDVYEQVKQASGLARIYLKAAIKVIDGEMGEDFSFRCPRLVSHVMATIEREMTAEIYARTVHLNRQEEEVCNLGEIADDVIFLRDLSDECLVAVLDAFNRVYIKDHPDATTQVLKGNAERLARVFGR